jgi:hypothetical protein
VSDLTCGSGRGCRSCSLISEGDPRDLTSLSACDSCCSCTCKGFQKDTTNDRIIREDNNHHEGKSRIRFFSSVIAASKSSHKQHSEESGSSRDESLSEVEVSLPLTVIQLSKGNIYSCIPAPG